jgi:orotidine-5'-phosphate decarboxylase
VAGLIAIRTQPIVALDVPTFAAARRVVETLGEAADFYKVGLQLFTADGARVIEWLHGEGKRVFLDLTLHDSPNTVRHAAENAARMHVALLTVHAAGGDAMVRAAVEGAGERTGVLAVTVLTSMDAGEFGRTIGREVAAIEPEVLRLAGIANAAGAHGVVCSGHECSAVRREYGAGLRPLIPGIRFSGGASHDQSRIVTPAEAAAAGAAYVVVGRAVTGDQDPAMAFDRVRQELSA